MFVNLSGMDAATGADELDQGTHIPAARSRPWRGTAARMHQALQGVRHEAVVDEEVLMNIEVRVVALEIAGVLHFTTSLVYQNNLDNTAPGWVVTGIADFVRLRAGYIDPAERSKGGAYDGPYSQTTAFFFDYLATRNPDIVYLLNQRLLPEAGAWSDDAFVTFMGSDLDTLWEEYQASIP